MKKARKMKRVDPFDMFRGVWLKQPLRRHANKWVRGTKGSK